MKNYFAGIDIGSTSIKIVLIDEEENIIDYNVSPTGSLFHKNALEQFDILLKKNNISKEDVKYVVSTGYGRKLFRQADEHINEITANAEGIKFVKKKGNDINTIINIGGQDSKVIVLDDNNKVMNFAMNDKCAAGTGKFLEMAARTLEVGVDELGELHFDANNDIADVNSTCAVFAESEIISLLAAGESKSSIIAGIHFSIAKRIMRLASQLNIRPKIIFDGGTALNKGLINALEEEFMEEIFVWETPEITSAAGAALIAKNKVKDNI